MTAKPICPFIGSLPNFATGPFLARRSRAPGVAGRHTGAPASALVAVAAGKLMRRGSNPRRAFNKDGTEIVPMMLATMRSHGVRSVLAWCNACGHHADVNADHLPDDLAVPDVALRMRCSKCGSEDIATLPERWDMEVAGKGYAVD